MLTPCRRPNTLFGALALLAIAACAPARAQEPVYVQVANFTLSGGDPTYPVASDVTFQDLTLTELFADGTTATPTLFDTLGNPTSSLGTAAIFLSSPDFFAPDPVHGALSSLTLTGSYDVTDWDIRTSFGGPVTTLPVAKGFRTTLALPGAGAGADILGVDPSTTPAYSFAAGRITLAAVPEPGALALLVGAGVAAGPLVVLRRRRA